VLGHNFPDSQWYKDSYSLLRNGGYAPSESQGSWISQSFYLWTAKGAPFSGKWKTSKPSGTPQATTLPASKNKASQPKRLF
jgi:hypothetical protein